MSLIRVDNINKSYFGKRVLSDLSLRLDSRERLALTGSNGSGKTTLLTLLAGLNQPGSGKITLASSLITGYLAQHLEKATDASHNALYNRKLDQLERDLRTCEQQIAALDKQAQKRNPYKQTHLLAEYSRLTAAFEAAGGYDFSHRMQEALDGLGLASDIIDRPLQSLSGGEQMRVKLANLLLQEPDLLLLDEPTNHLDTDSIEWLEEFLTSFKGAVLFVSHDRTFIDRVATAVAELKDGKLMISSGNYSNFLAIQQERQAALAKEIALLDKEIKRQAQVTQTLLSHRNISGYHAREKVTFKLSQRLKELKSSAGSKQKQLNFQIRASSASSGRKVLLAAKEISFAYEGKTYLFENVSFSLNKKQRLCLCGPNGCGKSTLLNLMMGQLADFTGQIELDEQLNLAYMQQNVEFAQEEITILEMILSKANLTETEARNLLAAYGFTDIDVYKKLSVLSGGERARVYLCSLLLEEPDILFLDEPTNHLDIQSREILEEALLSFEGAILAVSHDRYFLDKIGHGFLGFLGKKVLLFDTYAAYRKKAVEQSLAQKEKKVKVKEPKQVPSKADLRREEAKRRKLSSDLEKEIEKLEQEKEELESNFSPATSAETYEYYAQILALIEKNYEEYLQVNKG